ncbi:MAG: hypothetical protein ACXWKG_14885 [Limisphaerales bacterium]
MSFASFACIAPKPNRLNSGKETVNFLVPAAMSQIRNSQFEIRNEGELHYFCLIRVLSMFHLWLTSIRKPVTFGHLWSRLVIGDNKNAPPSTLSAPDVPVQNCTISASFLPHFSENERFPKCINSQKFIFHDPECLLVTFNDLVALSLSLSLHLAVSCARNADFT